MNLQGKTPRIVFYNIPPGMGAEQLNGQVLGGFEFATERRYLEQATAVIFHMPTLSPDDRMFSNAMKRVGQLWVFWSAESEGRNKWYHQPEVLRLFDITATYKLDSDVPLPYFHPHYYGALRRDPVRKSGVVCAIISDAFDQSNRLEILKELMSYTDVHCYGKMLNNMPLINRGDDPGRQKIMERYKFTIAFEDTVAKDYVTDELYAPLIAGSVPVYLGAPNIDEFLPGDHCYININDFFSVKTLADYLSKLDGDDLLYNEYLEWKTRPFRLAFNQKSVIVAGHPVIRLCSIIEKRMLRSDNLLVL